ncbi:MAG: hypothetical protein BroJett040_08160 [Oligoflexia bacterium]|nr:MAG: hypothetical protein BroJett040_08160 [Oligoflexia bacterium]
MKLKIIITSLCLAALIGCDQKGTTDSTRERAKAEQEANNDVENLNLAQKARKMESDLSDRHYFYSALEGQYLGKVKVENEFYNIKFNLVKSLPQYKGDRVRQLSEIENDLNNLFFHIQVIQWHPADMASAVGCRVSQIRPDMANGVLAIASSECVNLYTINLSDLLADINSDLNEKARSVAEKLINKEISRVEALVGNVQPSTNANTYQFSVQRVK